MSLIFSRVQEKNSNSSEPNGIVCLSKSLGSGTLYIQRSAKEKDTRRRSNNNVDDCLFQVFIEKAAAVA
jgi:hypothetical protein